MAKKRKAKKGKKKKAKAKKSKAKRVKARVAKKKVPKPLEEAAVPRRLEAAYTLSLAGGIIILIAGILAILGIRIWGEGAQVVLLTSIGMAAGLVCGLAILIATALAKRRPRTAGIVILIFSLIALIVPPTYGLIFGPILGLIGAILFLIRR